MVRDWLRCRPKWWKAGVNLFCSNQGTPIDADHFGRSFRRYRDFAGLSGWTLHGMRHYAGTQFAKVNPLMAAQVLGHKDMRQTMEYLHRDEDFNRVQAMEANPLGKVLKAGRK